MFMMGIFSVPETFSLKHKLKKKKMKKEKQTAAVRNNMETPCTFIIQYRKRKTYLHV